MEDKVIAITGGTGSFGQAMTRELLTKGVRQIRILSRDELKQSQMAQIINDSRVDYFLCDVRDADRLDMALEGVDFVIHAAAQKRIEKCELDPQEAIKTNIIGTVNVANSCLKNNIEKAIFISTDKACYPVNLYGSTKLAAEKVWIQSNTYRGRKHPTQFAVVRYGNVLGSRGSVLHLFKDQLDEGCLKVTDSKMTRFFITLQQAVDLVQLALEGAQGGEIFIPNLKAASIYDLARLMAGKYPITITNQRGGEKLHETLITKEEAARAASYEHYSVINPEIKSWPYTEWVGNKQIFYNSSEEAPRFEEEELLKLISAIV